VPASFASEFMAGPRDTDNAGNHWRNNNPSGDGRIR
jgi:hypothetical protein